MATPIARLKAIADALIDGAATNDQVAKLADAYVYATDNQQLMDAFGTTRDQLTNSQKAMVAVEHMRREARRALRYAAEQKAQTDASGAIRAAGDAAEGGL